MPGMAGATSVRCGAATGPAEGLGPTPREARARRALGRRGRGGHAAAVSPGPTIGNLVWW